jgi:isopenicillin-N epimerase
MESLLPGGWPEVMQTNHELALRARDLLLGHLAVRAPAPDAMIGSMAAVPLPLNAGGAARDTVALHDWLRARGVEAWLHPHPVPLLRVSAQLYNRLDQFRHLAVLLEEALHECRA